MSRRLAMSACLIAVVALLLATGGKAEAADDPCAATTPVPGAAGLANPFHQVSAEASKANEQGSKLYRQQSWDAARDLYRQAMAADPLFLAPLLNVACSFVRQERFGEAAETVAELLHRAYVPWSREVAEAADLGALRQRPEMKKVEAALAAESARWSEGLDGSAVYFVGRAREPVRLPAAGTGVFILGLRQEAFAYLPSRGVYRQLTATDGRVLAALPGGGGAWLAVVTGEKLVRTGQGGALRGLVVEQWNLPARTVRARWRASFDVERLSLWERSSGLHVSARPMGDASLPAGTRTTFRFSPGGDPLPAAVPRAEEVGVLVDATGAQLGAGFPLALARSACPWQLSPRPATDKTGAKIVLSRKGRPDVVIAPPLGAALAGLPF